MRKLYCISHTQGDQILLQILVAFLSTHVQVLVPFILSRNSSSSFREGIANERDNLRMITIDITLNE